MKVDSGAVIEGQLRFAGVADSRLCGMARREYVDVIRQRPPAGLAAEREARRVVRQVVALGETEAKLRRRFER